MSQHQRALYLAKRLWETFVRADSGQRVALTGAIVPYGSLKSRSLRRQLAWVETLDNKFVTLAVARRAVALLEKKFYLSFPIIPGVSVASWRETQAQRISKLCYRVKKNKQARSKSRTPKKAMVDDTLAYDAEVPTVRMYVFVYGPYRSACTVYLPPPSGPRV